MDLLEQPKILKNQPKGANHFYTNFLELFASLSFLYFPFYTSSFVFENNSIKKAGSKVSMNLLLIPYVLR